MKSEELLKSMNDIEDGFIEEASRKGGKVLTMKKNQWAKWAGGIAAVLAVCIVGGGLFFGGMGAGKSAPMEAEAIEQYSKSEGSYLGGIKNADYSVAADENWYATDASETVREEKTEMGSSNLINDSIRSLNKENLKLVYTANMQLQTTDYDAAEASLSQLVASFDGYFENVRVNNNGIYSNYSYKSGNYTIRIPAEKYTDFINSIGDVYHVVSLSQNVEDIGEQYFEVEGRLETLKTKRDRLNELLKTAGSLSDIIQLESELSNVEYEIDNYTTRLNHYDSLVGYSTVYVYVEEVIRPDEGIVTDNSFGARIKRAFTRGLETVADNCEYFVLWVVRNAVGIIIFAIVVIFLIKFRPFTKLFRKLFRKPKE